jgi:hypothetical protein
MSLGDFWDTFIFIHGANTRFWKPQSNNYRKVSGDAIDPLIRNLCLDEVE